MAKIIYKEGCEDINTIDCIEGIEINILNGNKSLIFPKYPELPIGDFYNTRRGLNILDQINALKQNKGEEFTNTLFKYGSRAAKFVRAFKSIKYGMFNLPTLLNAMEIYSQKEDIDAIAKYIQGASLLEDFNPTLWSCSIADVSTY